MNTRFGTMLRTARLHKCLSQQQLADCAGLSYRTISDLERGKVARPRPTTIALLAEALSLTPNQIEVLTSVAYALDTER
jgi:transcriptional regulator with XRE-family HTH domain